MSHRNPEFEILLRQTGISMAFCNGICGVEFVLRDKNISRAEKLLKHGVMACEDICNGSKIYRKKKITGAEFDKMETFRSFIFNRSEVITLEIEKEIKQAKDVVKKVNKILKAKKCSEKEGRELQEIFRELDQALQPGLVISIDKFHL